MYKVEVDPTLCRIIEIFRQIGIWPNEGITEIRKSLIRIFYLLHHFSFDFFIAKSVYEAILSKDINQLVFLVEAQIGVFLITVKLVYLLWRKDEIVKFLNNSLLTHCTNEYNESMIAKQKIRKAVAFIKVYTAALFLSLSLLVLLPLPIFTGDEKMLPLFVRFDLESDYDIILYWISYTYISATCVLSAIYNSLMLFIWYIMYNYAIEYKLLGHRLKSLGTKTPNTYQQELLQLIEAHNNLFK